MAERDPSYPLQAFDEILAWSEVQPQRGITREVFARGSVAMVAASTLVPTGAMLLGSGDAYAQAPAETAVGSLPPAEVVVLGHSVMHGRSIAGEQSALQDGGLIVSVLDAQDSRQTESEACDTNPLGQVCQDHPDLIRTAEKYPAEIGAAMAAEIDIGWNDQAETLQAKAVKAGQTIYDLGVAPDGIAPDLLFLEQLGNGSGPINDALRGAVVELNSQGKPAEFIGYSDDTTNMPELASGKIHPGPAGYKKLVELDAQKIPAATSIYYAKVLEDIAAAEAAAHPPAAPTPAPPPVAVPPAQAESAAKPQHDVDPFIKTAKQPGAALGLKRASEVFDSSSGIDLSSPSKIVTGPTTVPGGNPDIVSDEGVDFMQPAKLVQASDTANGPAANAEPVITLPKVADLLTNAQAPPDLETETPPPAPTPPPPAQAPDSQNNVEVAPNPNAVDFRSSFSFTERDGHKFLDKSALVEMIETRRDIFPKAEVSDIFPDGYYRMPDDLFSPEGRLPYRFADSTPPNERFASPELISLLIIESIAYGDMRQQFIDSGGDGPEPDENLTFFALTAKGHIEHQEGGDADQALVNNPTLRMMLLDETSSWREDDGTSDGREEWHHIISGDAALVDHENQLLDSAGYDRPNLILQDNHGSEAEGAAHWHMSADGASQGPFFLDEAKVPGRGSAASSVEAPTIFDAAEPVANPPAIDEPLAQPPTEITNDSDGVDLSMKPSAANSNVISLPKRDQVLSGAVEPDPVAAGPKSTTNPSDGSPHTASKKEPTLNLPSVDSVLVGNVLDDPIQDTDPGTGVNQRPIFDDNAGTEITPPSDTTPGANEPIVDPAPPAEIPAAAEVPLPETPAEVPPPADIVSESELIVSGLYSYFTGERLHMTAAGASGLMGNLYDESKLFPGRAQLNWHHDDGCSPPDRLQPELSVKDGGTKGYGFQLHQATIPSRQAHVQEVADRMGIPWTRLEVGEATIAEELESGYFIYDGRDVLEIAQTSDDVSYVSDAIAIAFEGPEYLSNPKWRGTPNYHNTLDSRRRSSQMILDHAIIGDFSDVDVACID